MVAFKEEVKVKYDSACTISNGFLLEFALLVWLLEQENKKLKEYFAMNNKEKLKWEKAAQELDKVTVFINGYNNKSTKETLNRIYNLGQKDMYPTSIEMVVQMFNNKYPVSQSHKNQQNNDDIEKTHHVSPEEAREGDLVAVHATTETTEAEDQVGINSPTLTTNNGTKTTGMTGKNNINEAHAETIALLT